MPTVRAIVENPALRLRVVAGADALDRPLVSAHVSELEDPVPWLHGGELLMTTGMRLRPAAARAYVRRLVQAGVSCLALGLGADLTHVTTPPELAEAAEEAGLPLLEVPQEVPFIAITEEVFAHLAAERYAEIQRAFDAQRSLTAAAVHPGGIAAVTTAFASATGMWAVVTDTAGHVLAAVPDSAAGGWLDDVRPQLARLRSQGLRASASLSTVAGEQRIQPLGAQRLRGFLVYGQAAPLGQFERLVAAGAVSLLSIELERLHAVAQVERRRRTEALRRLVAVVQPAERARSLLASVGITAAVLRAVAVDTTVDTAAGSADTTTTGSAADTAAGSAGTTVDTTVEDLAEAYPAALLEVAGDEVVLLVPDPPGDLADALERLLPGRAVGLGTPVHPEAAAHSLRQARQALRMSRERGGGVTDAAALASSRLLLEAASPAVLAAYAETVLGPVERADRPGRDLCASLRAFLEANGSLEAAAAALGVHRHTLRNRMRRVERLTGRRLDSSRDRMELWLAFEARDLAAALDTGA
ncbi:hypothetical protein TH66_11905 [Carbonactinospora thermoautotrophica]|uniref:PucR family transcriptional regulator n=1 Tax=Carbonactinospora thermoautotrophica TaxID=1469144 RepID=A0A132N071_9ACTN|nr:PucR family transcriptional regulator [Carbonactinospora thermoautotrophica]KWX03558.1 hypothetical protein TH66_11905 [Carbonactinospora thermoautotrophica]